MNPIAEQLNKALEGTIVDRLLSQQGRRMFFPKGIVAQSAEASAKATRFNATVGMAVSQGNPIMLPSLKKLLPSLTTKEAVGYAPTGGIPNLRKAWQDQILEKNPSLGSTEAFSLPMVIPGLTSGIFQVAELFLDSGDEVLSPDMFWGNYRLIVESRRQAKLNTFRFFNEKGGIDLQAFTEALASAAKRVKKLMVILNFPNNPSGYTPNRQEAAEIVAALEKSAQDGLDLLLVCDDAYFGLFFEEDCERESLFSKVAGLHPNILAVKIDGSTKEDLVWGFRVGFISFAAKGLEETHYHALLQKLMGSIRSSVSSSPGISQHLIAQTLQSPSYRKEKAEFSELMKGRYAAVKRVLESEEAKATSDILNALPCNSGYFMSFTCKGISAEELRLSLLDQGIGTIAIGTEFLRIAFSSVDEPDIPALYSEIFKTARSLKA